MTSLGWVGEAEIFASLPLYPIFPGGSQWSLAAQPSPGAPAVHNSGDTHRLSYEEDDERERPLAIWNDTAFEKSLKRVLKNKLGRERGDEYISLYVSARKILLEDVLEEIRGHEPSLTDHGPSHIQHVLENVFKLLEGDLDYFSPIEHYILGLSVLFHDVGNLHGRENHSKRIARFYDHVRNAPAPQFAQEKALVVRIAQAHTGEALNGSRNTLADVPEVWQLNGAPVKTREVAAIVRFADELAEGRQRTSEYLRKHGLYPAESAPHHDYSSATDITIDRQNERIAITYQFSVSTEGDLEEKLSRLKEFLKYAAGRLAKMDIERRYARFHCPKPLVSFRRISACLDIQVDGEFVQPPLEATLSDEVHLDGPPELMTSRAPSWNPESVAARVRHEVLQRTKDDQ